MKNSKKPTPKNTTTKNNMTPKPAEQPEEETKNELPKGFLDLLKIVMKEPQAKINGIEIWNKYIQAALIGAGRSEADIIFLMGVLKKQLGLNYISKIDGSKWSDEVTDILNEQIKKLEYEEDKVVVSNFLKELFRITASLKGSARFFERRNVIADIDKLADDSQVEEFIEEIAEDEDVSNVRQTKVIIWLHSIGKAKNFIPTTRQIKSFVNEVFGYYPYYEDDKYFIAKAKELLEFVKVKNNNATGYDLSRAIFYYIAIKSMIPRGFGKAFNPDKLLKFMQKNKFDLKKLSEFMADVDNRMKLMEMVDKFVRS